jgi:hypothetical protein
MLIWDHVQQQQLLLTVVLEVEAAMAHCMLCVLSKASSGNLVTHVFEKNCFSMYASGELASAVHTLGSAAATPADSLAQHICRSLLTLTSQHSYIPAS